MILTPFKLVTVFLHEASHAFACKLTCGHVEGIQVHADGGGTTKTRGGIYCLILLAGYLGSSFWGMVLILASTNLLTARIAAGCFIFALLVVLCVAKNALFFSLVWFGFFKKQQRFVYFGVMNKLVFSLWGLISFLFLCGAMYLGLVILS